jgi:hypothetical protein
MRLMATSAGQPPHFFVLFIRYKMMRLALMAGLADFISLRFKHFIIFCPMGRMAGRALQTLPAMPSLSKNFFLVRMAGITKLINFFPGQQFWIPGLVERVAIQTGEAGLGVRSFCPGLWLELALLQVTGAANLDRIGLGRINNVFFVHRFLMETALPVTGFAAFFRQVVRIFRPPPFLIAVTGKAGLAADVGGFTAKNRVQRKQKKQERQNKYLSHFLK